LQAVIASEVEVIKFGGAACGMRDGVAQKRMIGTLRFARSSC
jgi:hypothetical protein